MVQSHLLLVEYELTSEMDTTDWSDEKRILFLREQVKLMRKMIEFAHKEIARKARLPSFVYDVY